MTSERLAVEEAIREESCALADIADRLRGRVPWAEWPVHMQEHLLAACFPSSGNQREHAKAAGLRWHLFRADPPQMAVANNQGRVAERIRADLIGLVPLGCGRPPAEGRLPEPAGCKRIGVWATSMKSVNLNS
jgi:hypothetical protein